MVTSSSATQGKTHWAIAIGIGQYPLLPPLAEAETNVVTVAQAWQSQTSGSAGTQYRTVILSDRSLPLLDRPTYPNRENLEYWLDFAATELVNPGDTLWCFFSGYGVSHRDRDYLLPIEASLDRAATAGIPLRRVCEYLKLASDRVGPGGQVLLVLDLSRPPADNLAPVGGEIPLLAQEMGLSILLAEPGAGRQSSGLLAPALAAALGQSQGMNLYALSRFLRETTRALAQEQGRVAPQVQVFAHPHERLYETVVGRMMPEPPRPIESFVVFPASAPALAVEPPIAPLGNGSPSDLPLESQADYPVNQPNSQPNSQPNPQPDPSPELGVFGSDQVQSPALDDEALDRFASAANLPDAWATEPSAFEALFANDWVPTEEAQSGAAASNPFTPALPNGDRPAESVNLRPPSAIAPVSPIAPMNPNGSQPPSAPPPEPIPESQRDLALIGPLTAGLSASDLAFARQLVTWLGVFGIVLLAAVVARNYAALFGANITASTPSPIASPAPATPLPAPANGASPPTGSRTLPPPEPSPLASPQPAPVAQSGLPSPKPSPQVSPNPSPTPPAASPAGVSQLSLARIPIGTNQASEFGKAILQARQIKPGDPGYGQAQQAIDRWSRVILDLAKGRALNGDFGGAIAAAKIVAPDRGEVYQEARSSIAQWQTLQQQQANNRATLQKAASQIQLNQASSYNRAIDLARSVPVNQPGYPAARDQINLWSQEILKIAQGRANANQLAAAIQTASLVPPNTAAYASAQQAIAQWKKRALAR